MCCWWHLNPTIWLPQKRVHTSHIQSFTNIVLIPCFFSFTDSVHPLNMTVKIINRTDSILYHNNITYCPISNSIVINLKVQRFWGCPPPYIVTSWLRLPGHKSCSQVREITETPDVAPNFHSVLSALSSQCLPSCFPPCLSALCALLSLLPQSDSSCMSHFLWEFSLRPTSVCVCVVADLMYPIRMVILWFDVSTVVVSKQ